MKKVLIIIGAVLVVGIVIYAMIDKNNKFMEELATDKDYMFSSQIIDQADERIDKAKQRLEEVESRYEEAKDLFN